MNNNVNNTYGFIIKSFGIAFILIVFNFITAFLNNPLLSFFCEFDCQKLFIFKNINTGITFRYIESRSTISDV